MTHTAQVSVLLAVLLCFSDATKLPDGHLQPIGNSGPNVPVEVHDGFPKPAIFVSKYMNANKPLVMRGALKDSPALKLWNDAYLRSKTPTGKKGDVFVEQGKKENRSEPSGDMHFLKFLDQYNTSDMYMVHHVPSFLAPDIIMPFCIQCEAFHKNFADTVMWFSSGGTKSVFHNDGYENINCLYRGKKHLVMVNVTKYRDLIPKILDVKSGSFSSADVEKIDLFKYPFYVGMEFHIADMTAGDCLYIPFAWFHHVSSEGSNLAVNVWMSKTKVDLKTCKDKPDNTLTLNKFTFKENEEPEDPEPYPSSKDSVSDPPAYTGTEESSAPAMLENLAAVVLGETGTSATKAQFLKKLSEGNELLEKERKLLEKLFIVLDRNKNGKWDENDMKVKLTASLKKVLEKAILRVQRMADRMQLSYDLIGDLDISYESDYEEKPSVQEDKDTPPTDDPTIYTTLSDKDEL